MSSAGDTTVGIESTGARWADSHL